jgi:hypothetical protein
MSQMMASHTPKVSDVAMVCYLDLCKAAVYVPPTITDSALRALAPEMADELKVFPPSCSMPTVRTSNSSLRL